jgi:mRNA-degrading endonuclease RelE of RelBE toxin-antitoxin system
MTTGRERGFRVRIERDARKAFQPGGMSPRRQRTARQFIASHLKTKPLERIPGKVKELRGRYKGIMQFDIDDNYRLLYRVDRESRTVLILYIGTHPKW